MPWWRQTSCYRCVNCFCCSPFKARHVGLGRAGPHISNQDGGGGQAVPKWPRGHLKHAPQQVRPLSWHSRWSSPHLIHALHQCPSTQTAYGPTSVGQGPPAVSGSMRQWDCLSPTQRCEMLPGLQFMQHSARAATCSCYACRCMLCRDAEMRASERRLAFSLYASKQVAATW